MRLIGGSLLPVAVNLQVGGTHANSTTTTPELTMATGAVGISVPLPTPGISIEPYFSPGIRYRNVSLPTPIGGHSTEFGYTIGANLGFGLLGAHVAYDGERRKGRGMIGTFGIGLHLGMHLPLGM
jgi:hypothetical protein